MLLLVLILVLIAFGLLLVGFLSSSVLWAWVSVAVSVGAAGVLLYDTLQRRSVVRAGDEAGDDPAAGAVPERVTSASDHGEPGRQGFGRDDAGRMASGATGIGRADIEPVTEVLPVIRPAESRAPAVDPRFDPDADSQQTVMMPAVQPSGSPPGPSGAIPGQAPSRDSSSPTVTVTKADRPAADASAPVDRSVDQPTVFVRAAGPEMSQESVATPLEAHAPEGPAVPPPAVDDPTVVAGDVAGGVAGAAAATTAFVGRSPAGSDARPDRPDEPGRAADVEATTDVAATPPEKLAPPPAETPGSLFVSGSGDSGSTVEPADGTSAFGTRSGQAPPPGARTPEMGEPADAPPTVPPPTVPPPTVPGMAADTVQGVAPQIPPADAEPPEEQADPAAAAVVAGLEDEVLVVDERPRYHVPGCRALVAAALIPLPAREAVELGFTPCGWCAPDRTLAGRHPATAR